MPRPPARAADVCRRHPLRVLVFPIATFIALTATFVSSILAASATSAAAARGALDVTASIAAERIADAVTSSLAPLATIRSAVEDGAGGAAHAAVIAYFSAARARLVAAAPAVACLQVAPFGHVAAIFPLMQPGLNLTGVLAAGGLDLFNASNGLVNYRPAAVEALESGDTLLQGPQPVFACVGIVCSTTVSPALALIARMPIYPPAAAGAPDAWSGGAAWPGVPGGAPLGPWTAATNCSTLLNAKGISFCDADGVLAGRRFWGFATAIFKWDAVLALAGVPALDSSVGVARWSVARSAFDKSGTWTPAGASAGALPTAAFARGSVGTATAGGVDWAVSLEPLGATFTPAWTVPLVVASVVVSAVVAASLLWHLLSTVLFQDLLYSALPSRAIAALAPSLAARVARCTHGGDKRGAHGAAALFSESFDHVTIIFTDIVGFTELVSRIAPADTMALLTQLFAAFDAVTLRYGATKVETVGDAYMLILGTAGPLVGDAAGQARAAAALALDLVDAAGAVTRPDGAPLRIRAGAHCGPIVAGIVGLLVPHWSPFGDTVNFAARMESTGAPIRLHVSAALAALLRADKAFAVVPATPPRGAGSPARASPTARRRAPRRASRARRAARQRAPPWVWVWTTRTALRRAPRRARATRGAAPTTRAPAAAAAAAPPRRAPRRHAAAPPPPPPPPSQRGGAPPRRRSHRKWMT